MAGRFHSGRSTHSGMYVPAEQQCQGLPPRAACCSRRIAMVRVCGLLKPLPKTESHPKLNEYVTHALYPIPVFQHTRTLISFYQSEEVSGCISRPPTSPFSPHHQITGKLREYPQLAHFRRDRGATMALKDLELVSERFVSLLGKLIGEAKYLQNNPPELVPKEDRAARHVLEVLSPLSIEEGGPLIVKHVSYVEGRGNIIVEYPGSEDGRIVSFVGCHMDVVTANPEDWEFDPFSLKIDGDKLCGRGTTDCLGHVALVTELMRQLGQEKPKLKTSVVAVFIANEENSSITGVGVDALVKDGLLDKLKSGPLMWIDTADKQPCIGTGSMIAWKLRASGKLFHSGLAHKAINPLELAMEALKEIQTRFYTDFPPHPEEVRYGFATPSTMKPTQWTYPGGGINQIPAECTISGDCRITPFYDVAAVATKIQTYVDDINANLEKLATRGPVSKYELPEEGLKGRITWECEEEMMRGVACKLDSKGFHALCEATEDVIGVVKPYSITGSLPLIKDLQDEGFDVQTAGYGVMATYHAKNEYCLLSDFQQGFRVLARIIDLLDQDEVSAK